MKKGWVSCEERLPDVSGTYRVKYNCGSNGGVGKVPFDPDTGWTISDVIKDFYKVLAWKEEKNND